MQCYRGRRMPEIIETVKCVGCRSCEVACSFHHRKRFWPAVSSIEVRRREKTGRFGIVIHTQDEKGRIACDGCGFCIDFCTNEVRDELAAILEKETSYRKGAK
jgi:Fe-S-cluster-containing dehydrogenase component